MKKGQVKVGKTFEGDITVTVVVTNEPEKNTFSYAKAFVFVAVAFGVLALIAAVLYGAITGDYGALKAIADAGKGAFELAASAAKKEQ